MVSYGPLLVMIPAVFDKTQVWLRKSILSVKSYSNLALNHFELIRDIFEIPFGGENMAPKPGTFEKWE